MFPKLVREAAGAKSRVLGQAFLGTAVLGMLAGIGCTLAAWLLPSIIDNFPTLAGKKKIITEITPLIPYFIWSMLPLALGNVFVAALLAKQRYRTVPWLVGIALAYGLTLAWLANSAELPSPRTIILTLGGFNLTYLGTSAALAKLYAATPECR